MKEAGSYYPRSVLHLENVTCRNALQEFSGLDSIYRRSLILNEYNIIILCDDGSRQIETKQKKDMNRVLKYVQLLAGSHVKPVVSAPDGIN